MKPFNLEEAKQGKPICTKAGRKARIVCFDARIDVEKTKRLITLVTEDDGYERVLSHDIQGRNMSLSESVYDLMMADEEPKCPFKPFNEVLVRDTDKGKWKFDFFEHYAIEEHDKYPFKCINNCYTQCIPYNEETEHLIGTTDEAPEKYIIWQHV